MKRATYWWGQELLAETEEDEKLLIDLNKLLTDPADHCYEHGEKKFETDMNQVDYKESNFYKEDIQSAKCILTLER